MMFLPPPGWKWGRIDTLWAVIIGVLFFGTIGFAIWEITR